MSLFSQESNPVSYSFLQSNTERSSCAVDKQNEVQHCILFNAQHFHTPRIHRKCFINVTRVALKIIWDLLKVLSYPYKRKWHQIFIAIQTLAILCFLEMALCRSGLYFWHFEDCYCTYLQGEMINHPMTLVDMYSTHTAFGQWKRASRKTERP